MAVSKQKDAHIDQAKFVRKGLLFWSEIKDKHCLMIPKKSVKGHANMKFCKYKYLHLILNNIQREERIFKTFKNLLAGNFVLSFF